MLPSVVLLRALIPIVVGVAALLASTARASTTGPASSFTNTISTDIYYAIGEHIAYTQPPSVLLNFVLMSKSILKAVYPLLAKLTIENELGNLNLPGYRRSLRRYGRHARRVTVPGIRKVLANLDRLVDHSRTKVPLSLARVNVRNAFKYLVMNMASDYYGTQNNNIALLDRFSFDAHEFFLRVMCRLLTDMAYAVSDQYLGLSDASKATLLLLKPTWERVVGQLPEGQRNFVCYPAPLDPGGPLLSAAIKDHVPYLEKYVRFTKSAGGSQQQG